MRYSYQKLVWPWCCVRWYCYSFLFGFKCAFWLYYLGFSISWYGYRYHVTLCISQLHPIIVYRTGFGCALFWCRVPLCAFILSLIEFYFIIIMFIMIVVTIIEIFMAILFICNYTFRLSVTFPPLDILLEYWIEHVTFGLLYVMFTFSTRIFYRGIPGFVTDCPCGVWFPGLTSCLLYVGPLFWKYSLKRY